MSRDGERSTERTPRRAFLAGTAGIGATALNTTGTVLAGDDYEGGSDHESGRTLPTDAPWKPTAHDLRMDDGHRLRVWERTAVEDPDEAVIFVHGMTYGAVSMFDPPVDEEFGWLQYAAAQGQAAFAPDMRGYGETELPPEYGEPPEANTPPLSFEREARDILQLTQWLREERGFDRIHYVGLSGGTWRGRAVYALGDPDYATVTLAGGSFDTLEVGADPEGPAYLPHTREEFEAAWLAEVPDGATVDWWVGGPEYTAEEVVGATWRAIFDSNQAIGTDPQTIINPLVLQRQQYHPRHIDDPTLVIRASSDETISREGALNLYDAVGSVDHHKRYVEIAGGTHFIFLERKREEFFDAVRHFQTRY
ncbi:alpha/beta hydrolase [Halopiger goleimassiliensis]|uniref:alpha/beta hydrolase n=1 Tax=Halopiger goleimassiliensis TaxID=1293048 RepID=UPI0006775FBB|nr:alpha/beta fold hydrolase [Halopiger goleimassiliensis]